VSVLILPKQSGGSGHEEPERTYPLCLPRSVKAEVERRAKQDGISVNQFVATAVAEKLAGLCQGNGWLGVRSRVGWRDG
jgi:hypothetical protein